MYGWYTQQSTTRILRALNEFQRYHTTTPSSNDIYLHRIIQHHNNVREVFNLGTALRPFHRHVRWVSKKHLSKRAEYSPNLQDLRSEGPLHQNEGYYVILVEGIDGIVGKMKIVQDILATSYINNMDVWQYNNQTGWMIRVNDTTNKWHDRTK